MQQKLLIPISIVIAGAIIGAVALHANGASSPPSRDNVSIVDGKQIVELSVKSGYTPRNTAAKAGIPTTLRFDTNGTFDCSSAVRIPSLGIARNLPPSGSTDIDLGTPQAGTLNGVCLMGMYSFQIQFEG